MSSIHRSLTFLPVLLLSCVSALGDAVIDWNTAALNAIRAARTAPPHATRALAMTHLAICDALLGIDRTHHPYHVTEMAPPGTSREAAIAAAAHAVLHALFTNTDIRATNLDALYTGSLAGLADGPAKADGITWGTTVGQAILDLRADDGSTRPVPYAPSGQVGLWRPTLPGFAFDVASNWAGVKPFTLSSASQFRPQPPPALTTAAYALEVNLTRLYGGQTSALRTENGTEIALFWADGPGTATPPGHWNVVAQSVSADHQLTLAQNARLFALLNLAVADAAIAAWDTKYHYDYWRPITAIREADADGNPDTEPDPTWTPLISTPPFPEYTSGHSTFSRSAATVLAAFFGSNNVPFTTTSDDLPGVMRSYPGFSEAADESGISRIFGGIHFASANIAGQATGYLVGQQVIQHHLRPLQAASIVQAQHTGGQTALRIKGETDASYVVQISTDLVHWTDMVTNVCVNGEFFCLDTADPTVSRRFYRVVAR